MATTSATISRPSASLSPSTIEQLGTSLRGRLIQPDSPDYDTARTVYNAMIDRRPALIAQCVNVADVMAVVAFARDNGVTLAVRGGGHNVAGLGTCDGGIVLDLGAMKGIRVDPVARTAQVEGGCTWGDVDHATHAFGLATPSGIISTTGVGGLTLGGGFGHLTRHFGLSCDNLLSADVVTADGRFLTASATQNPDLFWALRGGGGNFGVVTSFEFRLHPVSMVYGGPVFYPIEKTVDALHFFRDYMKQIPDEMSAFFGFHKAPPAPFIPEHLHGVPMAIIMTCYSGPVEQGEEIVRPVREFGPPAVDLVGQLPYPAINSMFDALYPPGLQHYWKADFVRELTDEILQIHAEYGPSVPGVQSGIHIYPQTGAPQRVAADATAYSYRDVSYVHNVLAIDPDPAVMPEHIAWMRDYWAALHPHSAGGTYVNFMMEEGEDRIRATYQGNYDRLAAVKATYDPTNLFSVNQNIPPRV